MEFISLRLAGSYAITGKPRVDERGYFMRTWDANLARERGIANAWVQENESRSRAIGIIRGLHFQRPPFGETKLVRVVHGAILDVFVDLRKDSPTYGQWDSLELSDANHTMAYIPKGFAHGFCTLSDQAVVVYKVDAPYSPEHEGGIRWNDETLAIDWPTREAIVSQKDRLPSRTSNRRSNRPPRAN
jgi:dTDP-4-dehydrorhamnose 3,5-epimerase